MTTQSPAVLPDAGTWTIDSGHSSARFSVVHHSVATFSAAFDGVSGAFDASNGRLHGSVEVASLHLPFLPMLKQHMLADDWFDAERFPLISFEGTIGEGLEVQGELTMRGQTRPVSAAATPGGRAQVFDFPTKTVADHIGIDFTAVIDRREFGLNFNNELPNGIVNLGWDVRLAVALELVQAAE